MGFKKKKKKKLEADPGRVRVLSKKSKTQPKTKPG